MNRFRSAVTLLAVVVGSLAAAAEELPAQNVVVDEGTFLLSRNGQAIGTERFTIRRTGSGPEARLIATGEVEARLDARSWTVSPALEVSSPDMEVRAYQVKVAGDRQTEIYMTLAGGRYQAKVVTGRGEELREFRASPGSILLDEGVVHHYYFLASRVLNGTMSFPGVVPTAGEQLRLEATDTGTERIQIAGQAVQAHHIRVEDGSAVREVWVDDRGRLLRVVHHGTGLRAERRDLPG